MDMLRQDGLHCAVAFWLVVPFYIIWYILFQSSKKPDPLGKYSYLIEEGKAKYD